MALRVGVVSTYTPTKCGIASFTSALVASLERMFVEVEIVRLLGAGEAGSSPPGVTDLGANDPSAMVRAVQVLSDCDVVIVQFEHGIFGGSDGADVVPLLERLAVPSVAVIHTVLKDPSPGQRRVVQQIARRADAVVVMSAVGGRRLLSQYGLVRANVVVIPHGASLAGRTRAINQDRNPASPIRIITWGLLGPGKGIEWAIEALALVVPAVPSAHYVIAGQTHPKVLARDGEAYRDFLAARAAQLGVSDRVVLDPAYRDLEALAALVQSAQVVLIPYDSPDQVSSGVLVEAVASGVPVVATRFPHALELLDSGAGLTVDQGDPVSMAAAIESILTTPRLSLSMRRAGLRVAETLTWDSVARQYLRLASDLVKPG